MTIGILYESNEWSDHKLAAELANFGVPVRLVNLEDPSCEQQALACKMLVSRVFASALFRGHTASLARMPRIAAAATQRNIPLMNPERAHFFECDKRLATEKLAAAGLVTPRIYACDLPSNIDSEALFYPCIIKPNCGGRTTCTAILYDAQQARAFLSEAPFIEFIVEEYVESMRGFLTRVEIVDGACALIMQRSIAENGLSAYRFGCTYTTYDRCPPSVREAAQCAARVLSFDLGSFDIVECERGPCIIDANSVSNVSADCTELFRYDLMKAHAKAIACRYHILCNTPTPGRKEAQPC